MKQKPTNKKSRERSKPFKKDKVRRSMYVSRVTHDYYTDIYNSYWLPYFALKFKEKALRSLNARIEIIEDNSYLIIPSKV